MSLGSRIEAIRQEAKRWDEVCVEQANVLVHNFRFERVALQKEWFEQLAKRGRPRGSHSIGTWCPLNLFTRLHNGSLQIYWQLVYRDRVTRSVGFKHLVKGKSGGYDLRQLLGHANEFERELVAEYEEEAQLQRRRWTELTALNRHLALMEQRNAVEGALVVRLKAAAAARAKESNKWEGA